VETVIVLALMGVLALVAVPRVRDWQDRLAVDRATAEVMAFYSRARIAGVMRAAAVEVVFRGDTLVARLRWGRDSLTLGMPGPTRRRVTLAASRSRIRLQANGVGWGAANTKLVLRRGAAAESLTTSRLGRLKRW
jgi:Tfp pilus assembly protein FimT